MLIRKIILFLFAISSGIGVAGGLFALITVLGVVVRFAIRTNTKSYIRVYESAIIFGATIFNIVWIYNINVIIGKIGCLISGVAFGMFVGAMAMALSETIKVFPIMIRRMKLTLGIEAMIIGFALGKSIGGIACYLGNVR